MLNNLEKFVSLNGPKFYDLPVNKSKINIVKYNKSQIFNCGYGKEYSVLEIVKTALKNSKKKLQFNFTKRRKGDVGYAVADNSKIKKYLKFKPKFNDIDLIIKSALKWEKKVLYKNYLN